MTKPLLLSMGTRPEIIKMAPVYLELKKRGAPALLLHTGQHRDMAWPFYDLFGITPDFVLPLDRGTQTPACELAHLSSLLLTGVSAVLKEADPSAVVVHGDTSSALVAALAAFYQQRPVAHVEAGLRSHNMREPFPEEMNRTLIARLARWHFAPTKRAVEHLMGEGIDASQIHLVGNTIVDAVQRVKPASTGALVEMLAPQLASRRMVLVTAHRRENHDEGVAQVARAVWDMLEQYPDMLAVWPVHPNPRVAEVVKAELADVPPAIAARLHLTQPLDYPVLLWLMKHAWVVMTDSGGMQEEAVALGKPVLILRDATERPEVLETGIGRLVGTRREDILMAVHRLHSADGKGRAPAKNPYGDGTAAQKICSVLLASEDNLLQDNEKLTPSAMHILFGTAVGQAMRGRAENVSIAEHLYKNRMTVA